MRSTPKVGLLKLVSLLVALAAFAAACSSSADTSGGTVDAAETTTDEQTEEVKAGESAGEDTRTAETGPEYGGRLVYGTEADVANPWAPYGLTCSISCAMPLGAVSDPLFDFDGDGNLVPVMAAGIESNADASEWTLTMRENIMTHDGDVFDANSVAYNINLCRASSGRGQDFVLVNDVEVIDDLTVKFTLSQGWAAFPAAALDTPCGTHMMSPKWLKTLESNPLRTESRFTGTDLIDQETVDTPATGDQAAPVSMGAFEFVEYTPGNGNGMLVKRFEDYWRGSGPNSTGEGFPYLDEIEFVIAVDVASRSAALQSGQFDIMHTANADEIADFRAKGDEFVRIEANKFGETNFFLINQADGDLDPEGKNAGNPLLDLRVRTALAQGMDRQRVEDERGAGIVQVANGPFSPGQLGYLEDNGYPEYDPGAALTTLEEYINDPERSDSKAVGDPISFNFNTTNDAFNVETNQLVASMWKDAFGDLIEVEITPIEQGSYVGLAVVGEYEVQGWRQHGGVDKDIDLRFWASSTVAPIGTPTFNFGRFHDPDLDALADASRKSVDPAERKAIFEDMNRLFGERIYFLPTTYTLWGIIAHPYVRDIAPLPLPDGGETFPVIAGSHSVTQIWCEGGTCE